MQLRNKQDFWSGVMFITLGLGFAYKATSYSMGTAARMGPGYFPHWLGILMAIIGAVILLSSLAPKAEKTKVDRFDFKILGIIVGAIVLFGFTLRPLGLVISLFLLVAISSMASHEHSWKVSLLNALFLTVLCWLAFVKGLGLIFPIWPAFLGLN
jgi:Tripartite tricarboxylate transporter TctB family